MRSSNYCVVFDRTSFCMPPLLIRPGIARIGQWAELIRRGGFGLSLPLQAALVTKVARVMAHCAPDCALVNASYPDAVNPVLKALNLNVLCGVGNVGILAAVWEEHATAGGPVSILAHHSDLSQIAHSDVPTNGRVRAWVRAPKYRESMRPCRRSTNSW